MSPIIIAPPRCTLSEREKRTRRLCLTPGCPYHAGYDPRVTLCHQCLLDEMVRSMEHKP